MTGGILPSNPAGSVRGPTYVVTRGKTPVLSADEMRHLLDSIDTSELIGLRDRALIGLMGYSFARVSAAATLRVEDYFQQGRRSWLRLHEKGGKRHEVPCHHALDEDLDAWIRSPGIGEDKKGPLFRSIRKGNKLTSNAMTRSDALYTTRRRARDAALPLYLQLCSDLSKSGRDRPALPEVFKTVSSAWFVTLGLRRKRPNSRQGQRARIAQGWAAASKEESWKPRCSWESIQGTARCGATARR